MKSLIEQICQLWNRSVTNKTSQIWLQASTQKSFIQKLWTIQLVGQLAVMKDNNTKMLSFSLSHTHTHTQRERDYYLYYFYTISTTLELTTICSNNKLHTDWHTRLVLKASQYGERTPSHRSTHSNTSGLVKPKKKTTIHNKNTTIVP